LSKIFKNLLTKVLVISVDSDLLFPPIQQKELADLLENSGVNVKYILHHSDYGHDAFYADETLLRYIEQFLE